METELYGQHQTHWLHVDLLVICGSTYCLTLFDKYQDVHSPLAISPNSVHNSVFSIQLVQEICYIQRSLFFAILSIIFLIPVFHKTLFLPCQCFIPAWRLHVSGVFIATMQQTCSLSMSTCPVSEFLASSLSSIR